MIILHKSRSGYLVRRVGYSSLIPTHTQKGETLLAWDSDRINPALGGPQECGQPGGGAQSVGSTPSHPFRKNVLFQFSLVDLNRRGRVQWFFGCTLHRALPLSRARLHAPRPVPLQQPSVCSLQFRVSYTWPPCFRLVLFVLPFPYVHLFYFLNSAEEITWYSFFSD